LHNKFMRAATSGRIRKWRSITTRTTTRKVAVRVALGASRRRVLGMILFDVVKLTTPGVAVGLILAAALIRLNGVNMGISLSNVDTLA